MKTWFAGLLMGCLLGVVALEFVKYTNHTPPKAIARLPDGGQYSGELVDGAFEGQGVIVWTNGQRYEGEFQQGMYHGRGRLERVSGSVYEGEFSKGAISGYGVFHFSNGKSYEGEVSNGLIEGSGTLKAKDYVYQGDFKNQRYHGYGTLTYTNGSSYTGEFVDDLFDGTGTFITDNGEEYAGEFVQGQFTGNGTLRDQEGNRYVGEFDNWTFNGSGIRTDPGGNQYIGEFKDGQLDGAGEYIGKDGEHYTGGFEYGLYNGDGKLISADQEIYDGEFQYGEYHGEGTLFYAEPLDGLEQVSGKWANGRMVESDNKDLLTNPEEIAEIALYNQEQLLAETIATLQDGEPNNIDMYFLGIAGDGNQAVFRREVLYVKDWFDTHFNTEGRSAALINGKQTVRDIPLATNTSINKTLETIAHKMDAEEDILFVYMSSHGSSEFEFSLNQPGIRLGELAAEDLAKQLKQLPVRWKVIVVSACYSGGFIPFLADEHTLIMTAAADDRLSFGCNDKANFTYFGEAYFKDALPGATSFVDAFAKAKEIVSQREEDQDYEPSKPQIHQPEKIKKHLASWRAQLKTQQVVRVNNETE